MLHILLQKHLKLLAFDEEPLLGDENRFTARLYALRTVNKPFNVSDQMSLSSGSRTLIGMLLITSASCGRNTVSITSVRHSPFAPSISSTTLVSACRKSLGVVILCVGGIGSHLSSHTRIPAPFPTLHLKPSSQALFN